MAVFFFFQPPTHEMNVTQPSYLATPKMTKVTFLPRIEQESCPAPQIPEGMDQEPCLQNKARKSVLLSFWLETLLHLEISGSQKVPASGLFHRKFWGKEASLSPDKDSNPETSGEGQHLQEGACHNKHPSQEVPSAPKGREEPAQESLYFQDLQCPFPPL